MADWSKILRRGNVEDRRSAVGLAVGSMSLTGFLVLMAFTWLTGGNSIDILTRLPAPSLQNTLGDSTRFEGEDPYEVFASTVLGSVNTAWEQYFDSMGKTYTPPKLVLFRAYTQSLCGGATSEVGPHYCPMDETIYLDETFFDELTYRFGARGGDVAQAYVITHEVGHHVQNQLGTMAKVLESRTSQTQSIALELQADCYGGLWAYTIRDKGVLEPDEISEAMDAASAVGDDRIQARTTGLVNPETWTHGSSADRVAWFTRGYETGQLSTCDIDV